MPIVKAAGLLIYRVQPAIEFLLLQTSYRNNHWTPPKGHVDAGEDLMTAAIRETEEEAGLNQSQYKVDTDFKKDLVYLVDGNQKFVTYWLAEVNDKDTEIKLSHEHQAYVWCDIDKAYEYANFDDMKTLLNEAYTYIISKYSDATCVK